MKELQIKQSSSDPIINVVLDTLEKNKQALIFVNAKRSAEKVAADISKFLQKKQEKRNIELSKEILHLPRPTSQCEKLAEVIQQGIAFHHAGLTSKQKELIEDNFRTGSIKIICCTPTLAAGVDLPAFRTIIRDLKRFGIRGYTYIPVLEYLQMSGRAGRPKYDTEGESIIITTTESEKEAAVEQYVKGDPEDISSKLAVEPVLRTYILSLVASGFVNSREKLIDFFSKTFWAYQFEDMAKLEKIIDRMIHMLEGFGFISGKKSDFASAADLLNERIAATELGRKVSELYIDPLTAYEFIKSIRKTEIPKIFGLLQMISFTLEIRPRLNMKTREYDDYTGLAVEKQDELLVDEPAEFEPEYDDFMDSLKTAKFFSEWIEEKDDEYILENYDVRPGESRAKLETADWLLYSSEEIAKLIARPHFAREVSKLRTRMKYGAKEELLPLLRLREIGRVRARKLFSNGIKDLGDVKKADMTSLKALIGEAVAKSVKEQVGEKTEEIKETKRKGQMNLNKYSKKDLNTDS